MRCVSWFRCERSIDPMWTATTQVLGKLLTGPLLPWPAQGEMKLQIDRMIAKFFSGLPADEQLNFSVAVTVMKVQRKWRARMRTLRVRPTHRPLLLGQAAGSSWPAPPRWDLHC